MAKLRVGWTLAGCAPGVRTIVRSVLFHCITGFSCAAADSALLEGQMLREQIAHAVASDVEIRDMVRSSGKVKRHLGASHAWLCLPWSKTHGARKIFQGSSIISKWHVTPVSSRALVQIQLAGLESFEKADRQADSVSEFYSRILMNILWRIAEISRPNAARRRQQAVRRRAHPGPQRHPGRNTAIDGMALAATIAA